jgi:hypothetical protein
MQENKTMRKLLAVLILTVMAAVPAYAQREVASVPAVTKTTIPSPGTIRGFDPQPDPPGAIRGFDPQPEPPGTIRGFNPQPDPPHDPFRFVAGDGSV